MTEKEYTARRELLLYKKGVAEKSHCRLTALARERDLKKLIQDYETSKSND